MQGDEGNVTASVDVSAKQKGSRRRKPNNFEQKATLLARALLVEKAAAFDLTNICEFFRERYATNDYTQQVGLGSSGAGDPTILSCYPNLANVYIFPEMETT